MVATVLRTADLRDRHRELPDGWRRTMGMLLAHGGPWACPMDHASLLCYRCSICGKDLTGVPG